MREPKDEWNAPRAHERRSENDIDRGHVHDDSIGRKRAREFTLESQAALNTQPRAERAQLGVRGDILGAAGERQDDELVDSRSECSYLRDSRGEDRMRRIETLRDEDEPLQKKSVSPRVKRQAEGSRFKLPPSSQPMKSSERFVGTKPSRA